LIFNIFALLLFLLFHQQIMIKFLFLLFGKGFRGLCFFSVHGIHLLSYSAIKERNPASVTEGKQTREVQISVVVAEGRKQSPDNFPRWDETRESCYSSHNGKMS